jgi:hypothetical protein
MRKTRFFFAAATLWVANVVFAGIDLSDFDEDAMRAVEDASKELESSIAARDVQVTAANAEFIRDSLQWAEGYFAKKGNVADAVTLARQGREFAAAIAKSVNESDFDAASASYTSLVRTCKRCHDAYKPPSL